MTRALDAVDGWRGAPHAASIWTESSRCCARASGDAGIEAAAALLIEQEVEPAGGGSSGLERLDEAGAAGSRIPGSRRAAADRERFRKFRHALPELVNDTVRQRGWLKMGSDYAVPLAHNREMLRYYRQGLEPSFRADTSSSGHIGDAHVHVNILSRDGVEFEGARDLHADFAREAVRLGGDSVRGARAGQAEGALLELQYTAGADRSDEGGQASPRSTLAAGAGKPLPRYRAATLREIGFHRLFRRVLVLPGDHPIAFVVG